MLCAQQYIIASFCLVIIIFTAATALDGFFRMQKELEVLKRKVGELEGLKAFYLTQVQALRALG